MPIRQFKSTPARRRSQAAYRARNLEKRREATRDYRRRNPDRVKLSTRANNLKRKSSIPWRLGYTLRNRLRIAIKNGQKTGSAVAQLGCTIVELKQYIQSKFKEGMSWDNWGITGWHLDHIRPLSSFDLSDPAQFRLAAHFSNLQPLWSHENLKKGAQYDRAA